MTSETSLDVGDSPVAMPIGNADPSPDPVETSPAPEAVASDVIAGEGAAVSDDPLEGLPPLEELQSQAERKTPYAEGLLRLRTAYESLKAEQEPLQAFKPLTELGDVETLKSRVELVDLLHSPVLDDQGKPVFDERGIQARSARPFLEKMETESPGFLGRLFGDIVDYPVVDPQTRQTDTIARYYFRALGLDPNRVEEYRNIDSLVTKQSGAVSPDELESIAEPDRDAYKTLPSSIRNRWLDMEDDEQRYHLDGAKERFEARQYREQQTGIEKQQREQYEQQFSQRLQTNIDQDLATVRTEALTTLRDNLAKQNLFSGDQAISDDYIDAIIAPLALLAIPELQSLGQGMLDRMGVKLGADFNETITSLVTAREQFKRAEAYGDQAAMKEALRDANGKQAKLMAKFNELAGKRAEKFGYRATKIAQANGEVLQTATTVRAQVQGNGQVPQDNGLLPPGMDPRSQEAAMYQWNQSRG